MVRTALRRAQPRPTGPDLNAQIWHNAGSVPQSDGATGKRTRAKAEWVIKLRWSDYADLDVTYEWEISTQATPSKARDNVTRQAKKGRVAAEWRRNSLGSPPISTTISGSAP